MPDTNEPAPRSFEIVTVDDDLLHGLAPLAEEAAEQGIRNVGALIEQWRSGEQRFVEPGEQLLAATSEGRILGVGGLTCCPHVDGARRVRRFYVSPSARRRGVAGAIARPLLALGFEHTDTITCNARASPAAPPFWESLGFEPVDVDGITHLLRRTDRAG